MLDNAQNQPIKFRAKYCVEINDDARGTWNTNSQIKFKTSMLKSSLCEHRDVYILVSETISVEDTSAACGAAYNTNKKVTFKNCASFTDCINKINNTEVDNAKDLGVVMAMYNLIEYSDNYLKTFGSLWQYYGDKLSLDNNGNIADFTGANHNSKSFIYKQKITGQTDDDKNVEIIAPLKYLSNLWKTLAMPLINCEINLILT